MTQGQKIEEVECSVAGAVHGVMFRGFTRRQARNFGLVGEVQNLPDGTVKVTAQGEKEKLDSFLERLRKGSALSRVENVEVKWKKPSRKFDDFQIVF